MRSKRNLAKEEMKKEVKDMSWRKGKEKDEDEDRRKLWMRTLMLRDEKKRRNMTKRRWKKWRKEGGLRVGEGGRRKGDAEAKKEE